MSLTGVLRSYETPPPYDPTVALCLGTFGDPRGVGVSDERGTPLTVSLPRMQGTFVYESLLQIAQVSSPEPNADDRSAS